MLETCVETYAILFSHRDANRISPSDNQCPGQVLPVGTTGSICPEPWQRDFRMISIRSCSSSGTRPYLPDKLARGKGLYLLIIAVRSNCPRGPKLTVRSKLAGEKGVIHPEYGGTESRRPGALRMYCTWNE